MYLLTVNISKFSDNDRRKNKLDDIWKIVPMADQARYTTQYKAECRSCNKTTHLTLNENRVCFGCCGKTAGHIKTFLSDKISGQRMTIRQYLFDKVGKHVNANDLNKPFDINDILTPISLEHDVQFCQLSSVSDTQCDHIMPVFDPKRATIGIDTIESFDKSHETKPGFDEVGIGNIVANININLDDFKVITFKTNEHAITLKTYKNQNLVGVTMSSPEAIMDTEFTENPLFQAILKDKETGQISSYSVVTKGNTFAVSKREIKNHQNLAYYKTLDKKYKYGTRLKIKMYPGKDSSKTIQPRLWIVEDKGEKSSEVMNYISELCKSYGMQYMPVDEGYLQYNCADKIRTLVSSANGLYKTQFKYIGIAGFDIPKSELRQMRDIPYIVKYTGEESRPYVVVHSN